MKKTILREYARLIVRSGVNVQKGQDVLIYADLDQPEFVQMVVEEAYKAKARKVTVNWNYQPLQKLHVRYQSVKTLGTVEAWEEARLQHYVDILPCRIHLISEDPDGLKGVNLEKMAKGRQAVYQVVKPYADQRQNKEQWCIAAVPGAAWAKKVFPDLTRSQAMEKLWEAILATSRVNGDPVAAWEEHNRDLKARCDYLNSLDIESLHYTADNGTDFTVGPDARGPVLWRRGREHPGRLLQPQHTHGGVLYLPEAGPGRGHCLCHQTPELPGPADRGRLHPLCPGARLWRFTQRRTKSCLRP